MAEVLKEDDDKLEQYIMVEEPPKLDDEPEPEEKPAEPVDEDDDEDDEPSGKKDEDEDDDEDREAIRERRRQEKRERKERREKAIGRDKTELTFLRQQNDELERRIRSIEGFTKKTTVNDLDRQLQAAIQETETADRIIAKAVEAGNGEDVAKALKYRDQAMARAQQLYGQKQATEAQVAAAPALDAAVTYHFKEFVKENAWYDPSGKDEDSAIVLAIDNKLAEEGYDPRSSEYWEELQYRVKRRLPDKFEVPAPKVPRKPAGSPPIGSGREHAPTSTRREVYISPERKAAMQEAGVWDDPVLRQRYVNRYAEYDRENSKK